METKIKMYTVSQFGMMHPIFRPIREEYVDKVTDKSIWINGKRFSKIADYKSYFETIPEAVEYVRLMLIRQINRSENSIKLKTKDIEKYRNALEKLNNHYK